LAPGWEALLTTAFRHATCLAVGLLAAAAASTVRAESDEEIAAFYRSRPVIFEVGFSVGSAYDLMGRAVARFLGRHIPGNPTVIVINQPGAGSLSTANRAYNVMKRDGSEIATFNRSIFMEPLLGNKQARFDPAKFSWIGSVADEMSVCASWHASKVKTWSDLFRETFVVGANAVGSDTGVFANLIKRVFGAKIKVVMGYPGGAQITHAIESGEVDGRCGWSWSAIRSSKADWLADKSINILVQLGTKSHPELKDVPVIADLATTDSQREILALILRRQDIAWPIVAPPGIPPDRLRVLRQAFRQTMEDPDFSRDADKIGIEVSPKYAAEVAAIIQAVYQASPLVIEEVRRVLSP
jgi:tripartite-type tricarboxylate transporter receptor subunit TctC